MANQMMDGAVALFMNNIGTIMYWFFWGLIILLLILGFIAAYWYISHRIKVTVFPLYGSGKDGVFSFGKPKTNRIRKIDKGMAWKKLYPLFNRKRIEPFDSEYIYPGNNIYVFELNDEWIPGRINIDQTSEKELRAYINPVPHYLRNWQSMEHKKNAVEFAKTDWWENNKMLVYMLISIAICCALCGITIYYTYQFATGGKQAMIDLSQAIQNMGVITNNAPPG